MTTSTFTIGPLPIAPGDDEGRRARAHEDGFLYVPGLLAPAQLAPLRALVDEALARRGWLVDGRSDPALRLGRWDDTRWTAFLADVLASAPYQALAAAGQAERTLAVYERLCAKKEKLQGCGAFKSKAVGAEDRPTMAQLAMCEAGAWEHCEDASTKVAALVAWRSTLKAQGCKAGANALCANYKQCKGRAQWGCMAASAGEVCGCIPRCDTTVLAKAQGKRSWPDGTARGLFECAAAP